MSTETTYSRARAEFASYCDRATDDREIIIIKRRGAKDVALVAADELAGLLETAHLLRSPKNADRLLTAMHRARLGTTPACDVAHLRREFGLVEEEG